MTSKLSNDIRAQEVNYREALEVINKQHNKDASDLYQAIVIATLINGKYTDIGAAIQNFKNLYNGEFKIFKD